MKTLASALALLLSSALLAGVAEVYGRPLRGLSPVAIAGLKAEHRGKPVRVTGEVREASASRLVLAQGAATLAVESDGSFALPADAKGARATAEGKLAADGAVLVASGVEVTR